MNSCWLTLGMEGYGSCFVIRSFVLSTALQRAVLTSSCQLRYEQDKHVDGLQSDWWISLKCFHSRVMASSPLTTVSEFSVDKNIHRWLPRHL